MTQGEEKNGLFLALKKGNVATFGATSRRYREGLCQRRNVRANVATFQRVLLNNVATLDINVATLDINVATLQRLLKINVATLISHVATFQRVEKSMSRRWKSTS